MEFELAYYDFVDHRFNHYTRRTRRNFWFSLISVRSYFSMFLFIYFINSTDVTDWVKLKFCFNVIHLIFTDFLFWIFRFILTNLTVLKQYNCFLSQGFCLWLSHAQSACSIHWLLLCRGVIPPPNECSGYDTKHSDGEAPVMLELWGMQSTPSLPFLPGSPWPGIVAPDRVQSMG